MHPSTLLNSATKILYEEEKKRKRKKEKRPGKRKHFSFRSRRGGSRRLSFFATRAVTDLEREERSKLKRRSRKSVVGRVVVVEVTNWFCATKRDLFLCLWIFFTVSRRHERPDNIARPTANGDVAGPYWFFCDFRQMGVLPSFRYFRSFLLGFHAE